MRNRKTPTASDAATRRRMQLQARRDTKPELVVRRVLRELGLSYRIGVESLPGSPDIANRKRRWAIFVHGCYWHHHSGCRRATLPKNNREWWVAKFAANRERDARKVADLENRGMHVLVVWECETGDEERLRERLATWFEALERSAGMSHAAE